eukprot:2513029-Rhodomonas_salina.3
MERSFRTARTSLAPRSFPRNSRLATWTTAGLQSVLASHSAKSVHDRRGVREQKASTLRCGVSNAIAWPNPNYALHQYAVRGMAGLGGGGRIYLPVSLLLGAQC